METYVKICVTFFVILSSVITQAKAKATQQLEQVQILTGWQNSIMAPMQAVEIDLDSGWKTHAPGIAGIPPQFSFEGSKNLKRLCLAGPCVVWGRSYLVNRV